MTAAEKKQLEQYSAAKLARAEIREQERLNRKGTIDCILNIMFMCRGANIRNS